MVSAEVSTDFRAGFEANKMVYKLSPVVRYHSNLFTCFVEGVAIAMKLTRVYGLILCRLSLLSVVPVEIISTLRSLALTKQKNLTRFETQITDK